MSGNIGNVPKVPLYSTPQPSAPPKEHVSARISEAQHAEQVSDATSLASGQESVLHQLKDLTNELQSMSSLLKQAAGTKDEKKSQLKDHQQSVVLNQMAEENGTVVAKNQSATDQFSQKGNQGATQKTSQGQIDNELMAFFGALINEDELDVKKKKDKKIKMDVIKKAEKLAELEGDFNDVDLDEADRETVDSFFQNLSSFKNLKQRFTQLVNIEKRHADRKKTNPTLPIKPGKN